MKNYAEILKVIKNIPNDSLREIRNASSQVKSKLKKISQRIPEDFLKRFHHHN